MRDYLDEEMVERLPGLTFRSTLRITLGDGSPLNLATVDIPDIDGAPFFGKLAPLDALNLELTNATEGMNLQISNRQLTLGQNLINSPNALADAPAMLGCYQKVSGTNLHWHDNKVPGFIEVGDIDGEYINIFFQSLAEKIYSGKIIADAFPQTELPQAAIETPVYNDLIVDFAAENKPGYFDQDIKNGSLYYLPEMNFQIY